jgi:LytS/YehU family sensor histidine kinase
MFEKNAGAVVNPHFIFNSMNAIRYMIYENQDTASDLLGKLAELMRYQFNDGLTQTSLSHDLIQLSHLLLLESTRLEERITLIETYVTLSKPLNIPRSILLPIVECVLAKKDIYSVNHNDLKITTNEVGKNVVFTLNLTQTPKIKTSNLPLESMLEQLGASEYCTVAQSCDTNTYKMELTFNHEY